MVGTPPSPLRRYGVVPLAVASALLLRLTLWPVLGGEIPLLMLWPAVMFCGWYGGLGPGLLSTLLAALATAYLSVEPPHWFAADWVGVALFVPLGAAISALNEMLHRANRRAEGHAQEAARQREKFRVTLASIGDGVIATDEAGRVTFINGVARRLTGWPQEEAAGQPLERVFRIVQEETREPVPSPVAQAWRTRAAAGLANHTVLLARGGAEVPIDDSAAPIRGEGDDLRGVVLVFRDVAERRRLENELRQRADDLAEAVRHKDEFLAVLAHELRNPLAPIHNAVQVLEMLGSADPQQQRACDVISRQTRHLTRLVDDLLDASRIRQGKITLQNQPVVLAGVVANAIEMSRPLIEARRQALSVSLPSAPTWLEADPTRLAQVVTNLLNNAAKYTEEGGHIWLTAERSGNEAVLRVRDDGIGIAPEVLPRVFELFAQGERALGRAQGGLGIGLSLVRRLVEMHGGTITAHSTGPGKGSEFVVRLPALSDERVPPPGEPPQPVSPARA